MSISNNNVVRIEMPQSAYTSRRASMASVIPEGANVRAPSVISSVGDSDEIERRLSMAPDALPPIDSESQAAMRRSPWSQKVLTPFTHATARPYAVAFAVAAVVGVSIGLTRGAAVGIVSGLLVGGFAGCIAKDYKSGVKAWHAWRSGEVWEDTPRRRYAGESRFNNAGMFGCGDRREVATGNPSFGAEDYDSRRRY